jgi:hypothetical protein
MRGAIRLLVVCGLIAGVGAIVTSASGSPGKAGPSFAHASLSGALPQAAHLRAQASPFAAPPPPVNTTFVGGWALGKTTSTTVTTSFHVPKLTCGGNDSGVGPGAFIFAGPTSSETLDGAGVLVQCVSGAETITPALIVGSFETNFSNKVVVGDNLIATSSVGASGTTVTLQNTAAKRAFTLTLNGSDSAPDVELPGAFGTTLNGFNVPLPTWNGVQFKGTTVDGTAMGSQNPEKFLFTDGNCAVLLQPGPFDTATKENFKLAPPPLVVTGLSPTSGPIGTNLAITGAGFNSGTTVTFKGGAKATSVTHTSSTQLTAKVPNAAVTGPITLKNTATPVGSVASVCSYTVKPSITNFTPTSGITGSTVTINGGGFKPTAHVKFGTKVAKITSSTATQIKAVVPNGAISAPITVTTPAGTATSSTSFNPTLSVKSFTPTSGPTGTIVTINGIGFNSTSAVKFHGVAATTVTHTSSTVLKAKVPATATTGPITVTNTAAPIGTVSSATNYTVTPHLAPTITSFTPTSGPVGTSVTITGTNFSGASSVKFGGVGAPVHHVVSATQITATVPAGAVTGPISVTTAAGTGTSSTNFTVT